MMPQRFALFKRFLHRRLSPDGYLGLHLTIGVLCFIAASWLFAGIAEDVVTADAITLTDVQVAHWFHAHATPSLTRFMLVVSYLHGTVAIVFYVVLMGLFLARKKNWYWLVTLLATVPVGMLVNVLMKHVFQRARPAFNDPLLTLSTFSFPSGHTAGAALFYGVLATYLVCRLKSWRWRVAVVALAAIMVALVGLSRMYLGVHYLSDVLAAAVEGIAWLTLCLTMVASWRKHRAVSSSGNTGVSYE